MERADGLNLVPSSFTLAKQGKGKLNKKKAELAKSACALSSCASTLSLATSALPTTGRCVPRGTPIITSLVGFVSAQITRPAVPGYIFSRLPCRRAGGFMALQTALIAASRACFVGVVPTAHVLGIFSPHNQLPTATRHVAIHRRRIQAYINCTNTLSQRDRSPCHRPTPPIGTCQHTHPIGQIFTDLLLLFLLLLLRCRSRGSSAATTTPSCRGGSSHSTTRRNLSYRVTAIPSHTTHTRTDASLADPSAINYAPVQSAGPHV